MSNPVTKKAKIYSWLKISIAFNKMYKYIFTNCGKVEDDKYNH